MQYFLDAITHHYVDFEGRSSRKQFWMYVLWYVIIYVILWVLTTIVIAMHFDIVSYLLDALTVIFAFGLLLPNLAIDVRRLHDTGKSGWWILINLIPIVGFFIFLYFVIKKGEPGANKYGPSPLATVISPAVAPVAEAAPAPAPAPEPTTTPTV